MVQEFLSHVNARPAALTDREKEEPTPIGSVSLVTPHYPSDQVQVVVQRPPLMSKLATKCKVSAAPLWHVSRRAMPNPSCQTSWRSWRCLLRLLSALLSYLPPCSNGSQDSDAL